MKLAEMLVPEFDQEFDLTRKFLDLVPDDKLTWKPHEKSMELGRLAWHLATFPEWTLDTIEKDVFVITPEHASDSKTGWKGKSRADMLTRFDGDLTRARAALAHASDDDFEHHWKLEWNGRVAIDEPRYRIFRRMVLNHLVHHRAQLGVYFRMIGTAIPG